MQGRGTSLIALIVIVWLIVGAVAAGQRGYYGSDQDVSCKTTGTTIVTIIAGPLNYVGVNPEVDCKLPEPSK